MTDKAKRPKAKAEAKTAKPKATAPKKTGRPSGYSEQIAEKICLLISEGQSLRTICKEDGMPSRQTILNWILKNDEFHQQYARAREAQADYLFEECLEIADHSTGDAIQDGNGNKRVDHENINRSRLRVDTRKWVCAKLNPKKYSDKVTQEITGKDGGPIEMSDTDRIELLAALFAERTVKDKHAVVAG
jgi:hypothetical protein